MNTMSLPADFLRMVINEIHVALDGNKDWLVEQSIYWTKIAYVLIKETFSDREEF